MSILDLLQHIVNEPAPRLVSSRREFPREAVEFVEGCLDKDPGGRTAPKDLLVSRLDEALPCLVAPQRSYALFHAPKHGVVVLFHFSFFASLYCYVSVVLVTPPNRPQGCLSLAQTHVILRFLCLESLSAPFSSVCRRAGRVYPGVSPSTEHVHPNTKP